MKLIGMETNIHEEQGSPYITSAKCLGTPKEAKYEEYQRKIEKQASPFECQNVLLEPGLNLLSASPLLDHNQTSLQPGKAAGCVSATHQSETQHLCEELPCSARHKPQEDPLNLPSPREWPVLTGKKSEKKPERSHGIRVIKHTPSAITFSDFDFLSHEADTKLHISEAGEAEDFSSEEEEPDGRDDDDVFTELPLYEVFFSGPHRRNVSQRKQAKHELSKYQHICHLEDCDDHSEKELKDHDKEEKHMELETQPEKGSEWSDSMSCLMKKLEQLNLDIEEALSASSSPSNTPSTKRHKELCPVQVEAGFYGDHQGKGSWKNRRADYQDLGCLPYPVSTGARPKTDVKIRQIMLHSDLAPTLKKLIGKLQEDLCNLRAKISYLRELSAPSVVEPLCMTHEVQEDEISSRNLSEGDIVFNAPSSQRNCVREDTRLFGFVGAEDFCLYFS